jgi:uncharacterized protein (TIGR03437 family)
MIAIGGAAVTLTQSPCSVDGISPPNITLPSTAANGTITVSAAGGCPWNAVSNSSWLTVTGGSTFNGNAFVGYSVIANAGGAHSGTITIKNRTFTVVQGGVCTYTVTPATLAPGYRGESGVLEMVTDQNCAWSAMSDSAWASVSPSSGTGGAPITYTVQQNGGAASRIATINISGQKVQIQQAGNTLPLCVPSVSGVQRQYGGYFLPFGDVSDRFDVTTAWCGAAGSVRFDVNGAQVATEPQAGSFASHVFHIAKDFPAQLAPSVVTITPISTDGTAGQPRAETIYVYGLPNWLEVDVSQAGFTEQFTSDGVTYDWSYNYPDQPIKDARITFPAWIPYFGGKDIGLTDTQFNVDASVDASGMGSGSVTGQTGFTAFGSMIDGKVGGSAGFTLGPPEGLALRHLGISLDITTPLEKDVSVLDALAALSGQPELVALAEALPDSFKDHAMLTGEIAPSLDTSLGISLQDGKLAFDAVTAAIGLELKATLKVSVITGLSASGWVSGSGTTTIGFPQPYLRGVDVTFEAGLEADAWEIWKAEASVAYSCQWQASDTQVQCGNPPNSGSSSDRAAEKQIAQNPKSVVLQPIQRSYQRWGPYAIGSRVPLMRHAIQRPAGAQAVNGQASAIGSADTNQQLFQNVFPGANPQLVHVGALDLLVWAHQNPALPAEQSTDIAWSTNDGTGWSPIAFIVQDTRLEMSPVLGVDRNGNVVAAWQRVKDSAWPQTVQTLGDLTVLHKEMEVVYAVFNAISQTWGPVVQLTDDTAFDTDLHISTDADGALMLTWLSNSGGDYTLTATNPGTIKYAFWTGTSFNLPAIAVGGLVGVARHAAALKASQAIIVIQRDAPTGSTAGDALDLLSWNGTVWAPTFNYASTGENRLPSAVIDNAGTAHIVWVRNSQLVHSTLQQAVPDVIRDGSDSMAFYDTHLIVNPAGNLTLIWQQSADNGNASIFARIFDPVTSTWSADVRLNAETGKSHSVSGYYAADGTVQLAYLQTLVERTSQLVSINGSSRLLENIPADGRTDIDALNHFLAVDLGIANQDLQLSPPLPSAGAQASVQLTVHNTGSLPVPFLHANLYAGSTKVATLVSETALAAGDNRILTGQFIYPSSGGDITAAVNEEHAFTELTYDNNQAVISLTTSPPTAQIVASTSTGIAPVSIDFDGTGSTDPAGSSLTFTWLFSDGSTAGTGPKVSRAFANPGVYPVSLTVTNASGKSSTAATTVTVVAPGAPAFTADDLIDAASFSTGISPGSIASLFGAGLSTASGVVSAQSFPLPLQLQNASVTVNGVPAPILAVANVQGTQQINFLVPFETDPGQAQVVVSSDSGISAPISVLVLPAKPAVFMSGTAPIIAHGSTGELVTATSPAKLGETVVIYCTVLGPVAPSVPTGSAASAMVLSRVVLPVVVTVDDDVAMVDFAGLAPTFAGLSQINLEIPNDVAAGTSLPVVIEVNGFRSTPVYLPVTGEPTLPQ